MPTDPRPLPPADDDGEPSIAQLAPCTLVAAAVGMFCGVQLTLMLGVQMGLIR